MVQACPCLTCIGVRASWLINSSTDVKSTGVIVPQRFPPKFPGGDWEGKPKKLAEAFKPSRESIQ